MAKSAQAYCDAIDAYIADEISEESMNAILGERSFQWVDPGKIGSPHSPDNTSLPVHSFSGRSGFR